MSDCSTAPKSKRWKRVILCLGLLLLIGGVWRWNYWRVTRPFLGQWRLVDSTGNWPEMPMTVFQSDGRVKKLPWFIEPNYFTMNHDLHWSVRSGDLIVTPYTPPPSITDFRRACDYWINLLMRDDIHQEKLQIIEVSPRTIRLRLKADGAPESVYERVGDL